MFAGSEFHSGLVMVLFVTHTGLGIYRSDHWLFCGSENVALVCFLRFSVVFFMFSVVFGGQIFLLYDLPPFRGSFRALSPATAKTTLEGAPRNAKRGFQKGVLGMLDVYNMSVHTCLRTHFLLATCFGGYLCMSVYKCVHMYVSNICVYICCKVSNWATFWHFQS